MKTEQIGFQSMLLEIYLSDDYAGAKKGQDSAIFIYKKIRRFGLCHRQNAKNSARMHYMSVTEKYAGPSYETVAEDYRLSS
jgi:hypothetical protein